MTDTEIINGLQALLEEHFRNQGLSMDFGFGAMTFTIWRPPIHVPTATSVIQPGPMPQLRDLLAAHLQPHLVRLVTNKITR